MKIRKNITINKTLWFLLFSCFALNENQSFAQIKSDTLHEKLLINERKVDNSWNRNQNFRKITADQMADPKKTFSETKDGETVMINLQLPGSANPSDYYVTKWGSQLILNGDIVAFDYAGGIPTRSYSRNDDKPIFGKNDLYRWDNGVVPVELDNSVYESNYYEIIKAALDYYNTNTGIIFKQHTDEVNWLFITCIDDDKSGRGGFTEVGRQRNGSNILRLIKGSFNESTVLHELLHSLGIWHEQARVDRDSYISVNWSNIKESARNNFQVEGNSTIRSAYDYCSIMQYPTNAFAIDNTKPTITCISNGVATTCPSCTGTNSFLTKMDLDGLDAYYRGVGVSRFPSNTAFIPSNLPVAGCYGITDISLKNKWIGNKTALGSCVSGMISLGIFNTTYVQFEKGEIYHSPHGINVIYGNIYIYFKTHNGIGMTGLPLTDEEDVPASALKASGYIRENKFEKGVIVWGPTKAAIFYTNESYGRSTNKLFMEQAKPYAPNKSKANGSLNHLQPQ